MGRSARRRHTRRRRPGLGIDDPSARPCAGRPRRSAAASPDKTPRFISLRMMDGSSFAAWAPGARPGMTAIGSSRSWHEPRGKTQLSFAPSKIHVRMVSRSQIDSCFFPCGIRISGETRQSNNLIRLLISGSPGITIGPNLVPFITPSYEVKSNPLLSYPSPPG